MAEIVSVYGGHKRRSRIWLVAFSACVLTALLSGCGDSAKLPESASQGAKPELPAPRQTLLPTVKIAPAKGWPAGGRPKPAPGFTVTAFATGLDHPRTVLVLANGDVLVAESNAPDRPEDGRGIKGFIFRQVQSWAGAGVKSANRLTLLRDKDGDGVAETRSEFLKNLYSPFGMTQLGNTIFVANSDAVVRVPYTEGKLEADGPATKVADLPAGPLNHHWTKGLAASADGTKL